MSPNIFVFLYFRDRGERRGHPFSIFIKIEIRQMDVDYTVVLGSPESANNQVATDFVPWDGGGASRCIGGDCRVGSARTCVDEGFVSH